jgi:hypothetical protein
VPDVGYTKEEYDEFQKALTNPDLKLRADGLFQFIKTHLAQTHRACNERLSAIPATV